MHVTPIDSAHGKSLYEQVADRVQSLIAEGTLQPGDRLPSVRKLHEQLSVSISTVLEAYRLLEDRGLIQARPQSGYYVRRTALIEPEEPDNATPRNPAAIDNSLAYQVMQAMRDPNVVQLGAAVPHTDLLPLTTLNRLIGHILRYQSAEAHADSVPPGSEALRHEVARRLMDAGCSVTPDEIVITNGAFEAVYLSLRAVTQPGDTVVIESPAYFDFFEAFELLHLNALELPTHPQGGVSLAHLEQALQTQQIAACLFVPNFSNPLGSCMSDMRKQQLATMLEHYDIPLIEDDVFGDLHFQGVRPKAVKAFDRQGKVLYCSSVSKTVSPGLRIGWAVAGRYQARVERFKWVINQTTAMTPQLALAAFLVNGGYDRHLRHMRRTYQTQMTRMRRAITDYFPAETNVSRPRGGQVLWLEMPLEFNAMDLYQASIQRGISIAPGAIFSRTGNYQNCFRLNCSIPWSEQLEGAMKTLGYLCKMQLAEKMLSGVEHST
ncbi:GntR family transcriptional regulator [Candidatus Entotheonella serta]|nr:GntR family transcriptional regulator [Candidatus Entotheonella serta]